MSEENVYDPTKIELESWRGLSPEAPAINDLCNPAALALILQSLERALVETQRLRQESEQLGEANGRLRQEREDLRVELAGSETRDLVSLVEIPMSAFLGYAIGLVAEQSTRGVGSVILIVTGIMLLCLRSRYIASLCRSIQQILQKGKANDQD